MSDITEKGFEEFFKTKNRLTQLEKLATTMKLKGIMEKDDYIQQWSSSNTRISKLKNIFFSFGLNAGW